MGTDAGFFEKKSKRYFWFDRLSNIQAYSDVELPFNDYKVLADIYDRLISMKPVTVDEIKTFLKANIDAWMHADPTQQDHVGWIYDIQLFIDAFPDGEFFVATDSGDAYYYMKDSNMSKWAFNLEGAGQYEQWTPCR